MCSRLRPTGRLAGRLLVVCAVAPLLLLLPRVVDTSWRSVGISLTTLGVRDLLLLTAVWFSGLWCCSWVLTGALPGLARRRALALNLSGSAVANLLPFGGAAGVGVNAAMARSWGYRGTQIATYTAVSNLWDLGAKLAVIAAAAFAVGAAGPTDHPTVTHHLHALAAPTAGGAVLALGALLAGARSETAAAAAARAADAVGSGVLRRLRSSRRTDLRRRVTAMRQATHEVARRRWPQLTCAALGYVGLQVVLLTCCLHVLGLDLRPSVVLVAFAADRLATLVPISPAGTGMAETATAAVLVAYGGAPGTVAAAVLLYRAFLVLLEVPVGAGVLAVWAGRRVARSRRADDGGARPLVAASGAHSARTPGSGG